MPITCAITVAHAAPTTPRPNPSGMPHTAFLNMNSGSRKAFEASPSTIVALAILESLAVTSRLFPLIPSADDTHAQNQMSMYAVASRIASGEACFTNLKMPRVASGPRTASANEKSVIRSRPVLTSCSARQRRFPPNACAVVVITPAESPWNRQPQIITSGAVSPIAAIGASPSSRPTKYASTRL